MTPSLKVAKSLNTAILILSIIGLVATCVLLFFGIFVWGSASAIDYYQVFGGIGIIVFSLIYLFLYIFSVVCVCITRGSITGGSPSNGPFVLAIVNAVFCGLSGRYVTLVLSIVLAVKLNSAKKESLPNI